MLVTYEVPLNYSTANNKINIAINAYFIKTK